MKKWFSTIFSNSEVKKRVFYWFPENARFCWKIVFFQENPKNEKFACCIVDFFIRNDNLCLYAQIDARRMSLSQIFREKKISKLWLLTRTPSSAPSGVSIFFHECALKKFHRKCESDRKKSVLPKRCRIQFCTLDTCLGPLYDD